MQFNKIQVLSAMKETGMVPVFYHKDIEIAKHIVKACYDGGVRVFEFTDRGDFANEVFGELVKFCLNECPKMIMGVGTVVDPATASMYMQFGANFVVGPLFNPEIAKACNRRLIPYIPGCGSISEVGFAQEAGSDFCKIFPGDVLGSKFIKNIMNPMPWSQLIVTGGVEPTEYNLASWFKAGTTCVGMGSSIFSKEVIIAKNWSKITEDCELVLNIIKQLKLKHCAS